MDKVSARDVVVHARSDDGQNDCIGPYSERGHVHVDAPILNTPRVCCAGVGKRSILIGDNRLGLGGGDQGMTERWAKIGRDIHCHIVCGS